ncbi:MAG: hypothetical protein ABR863_12550 [Roseiarcus sp.]|jgi:hypothetical protein
MSSAVRYTEGGKSRLEAFADISEDAALDVASIVVVISNLNDGKTEILDALTENKRWVKCHNTADGDLYYLYGQHSIVRAHVLVRELVKYKIDAILTTAELVPGSLSAIAV